MRSRLIRGGVGSLISKAAEVVLGLVLAVLLARLLGAEGYGIYSFVFAVISVLALPARAGLPPLVVRETAAARATLDWGRIRGIWRWATLWALASGVGLAIAGGAVLLVMWRAEARLAEAMVWGLLLLPLLALVGIRSASLRGLGHVVAGVLPDQVLRPSIMIVLLLLVAFAFPSTLDAAVAMQLMFSAGVISLAIGIWLLRRRTPKALLTATAEYYPRAWLASALPLAATHGLDRVNRFADVILLGLLAPMLDVGIYRVAAQGGMLVAVAFTALNMAVAPTMARLHARSDRTGLQQVVRRTAQFSTLAALMVTLCFLFFGEWLVAALFGEAYSDAYVPLLVLAFGQLFRTALGPADTLLNMVGLEREVTRTALVATAVNVGLNAVLIPAMGPTGAALATSTGLVLFGIRLHRRADARLGIRTSVLQASPGPQ